MFHSNTKYSFSSNGKNIIKPINGEVIEYDRGSKLSNNVSDPNFFGTSDDNFSVGINKNSGVFV